MVGPGRLELPTPRLSSVCSNRLSYGPGYIRPHSTTSQKGQKPCSPRFDTRTEPKPHPCGSAEPNKQRTAMRFLSSIERKRNVVGGSALLRKHLKVRGVLRCDSHLTGAIYVLKSRFKACRMAVLEPLQGKAAQERNSKTT